ncbi:unnamed protein product [Blepharisma stoltei]|uniref:Uncharacterized protein n=1 Tax=Blepharisma stoltei TaxID=1481888 RepID=A0AAU9IWX8_9CILI|nr:unnamed protein product [Blepharisma stoltei]
MAICISNQQKLELSLAALSQDERTKLQGLLEKCIKTSVDPVEILLNSRTPKLNDISEPDSKDPDFSQCTWKIYNALVYGKQFPRWRCASTLVENNIFIFGGRGQENHSRNSFHILDLETNQLVTLKTNGIPRPREGHSMVTYENFVIVFGGCEGGEEAKPFNDVRVFDMKSSTWDLSKVRGQRPQGRYNHGAAYLNNQMFIYGGNGGETILSDMYSLLLPSYEWRELTQENSLPGPRENMGCTAACDKIFIFGGNQQTNGTNFSNELYEIEIIEYTANCIKKIPNGPSPPKRVFHTLLNLNDKYLVLFGGQNEISMLNDVWTYEIAQNQWAEIHILNEIAGRISFGSCIYKNSLVVLGGKASDGVVQSEFSVLNFSKYTADETSTISSIKSVQNSSSPTYLACQNCQHSDESCNFTEKFPEIGNFRSNFYVLTPIPNPVLKYFSEEFDNPLLSILRIAEIIGKEDFRIKNIGRGLVRGSTYLKVTPEPAKIDFNFLHAKLNQEYHLRQEMIANWKSCKTDKNVMILGLETSAMYTPEEIMGFCNNPGKNNIIFPLMRISEIAAIVSRNEEFLSALVIERQNQFSPCFFVVFDKSNKPVYPIKEAYNGNIINITRRSHLDLPSILSHSFGTTIYVYSSDFESELNEIYYKNIEMTTFLKFAYLKSPFPLKFYINSTLIEKDTSKKNFSTGIASNSQWEIWKTEIDFFSLLIYSKNRLIYWETKKNNIRRCREKESIIVKLLTDELISPITNQIKWEKETMYLFADIYREGTKRKKGLASDDYVYT